MSERISTPRRTATRRWASSGAVAVLLGAVAVVSVPSAEAARDPWGPEPVVGELFDMTSQGWSGSIPLGASSVTSMTITAKQDLVLEPVNWFPAVGENVDFALTGTCPRSLFGSAQMAAGDTCTVTWTMHPMTLAQVYAAWGFEATRIDATGSKIGDAVLDQHSLKMEGHVFEADDVDFGDVVVGSRATRPVVFRNVSMVDALLTVDGPAHPVVLEGRPVDPVVVPAGETVTLDAVFSPMAVAPLDASISYWTSLSGSSTRKAGTAGLAGAGIEAVAPVDPPVDPVDPPVDPVDPPVDPVDPPVDPVDPPVDPVDPPVVPELPAAESQVEPIDQAGSSVVHGPAGSPPAQTGTAPAATGGTEPAAGPGGADDPGSTRSLASTGGSGPALALGALALLCAGGAMRTWSRARSARGGEGRDS